MNPIFRTVPVVNFRPSGRARLEFYRRQIPEAGVQSLFVVDLLYELAYVLLGFLEVGVVFR